MHTLTFRLSLILIFIIPWQNTVLIPGVGTASKGFGFIVAAFWIFKVIVTGSFRKSRPFHVAVYLFFLWNALSIFWTIDVDRTMFRIVSYLQMAAMVLIIWDLYTTPAALKAGLQAYVWGAYISVYSMLNSYMAAGGPHASFSRSALGTPGGFNVNDIAMNLALGIPIAWYLVISGGNDRRANILKLVNCAYIPAALWVTLVTASRGTLAAIIPAFMFILGSFTALKLFPRILILAALTGTIFVLQSFVPQSSFERLSTTGTEVTEGDVNGRLRLWREGYAVFLEHPLIGVGSDAYRNAVASGKSAHNFILELLVDVGLIGFASFVIILFIAIQQARRQPKLESRFWYSLFFIWTINALTHNLMTEKYTWLFLSLCLVSANLSIRCDSHIRVYLHPA